MWNRGTRITVFEPREDRTGISAFFDFLPNGIVIDDLRTQVQIDRTSSREPDTCTVTISNLSPDTLAFLNGWTHKPLNVRVAIGFDGEYRHMFGGDVRWCATARNGATRDTTLTLADGDRAFRHARVNRSFRGGVSVRALLNECARSMGLQLPDTLNASAELETQFSSGYAMVGPTRDELSRLLAPYGYRWSVRDGSLIVTSDADTSAERALVIDGIIGSPAYAPPDKPGKSGKLGKGKSRKPKVNLSCLVNPEVTPGGYIVVDSESVSGTFKVVRVGHNIDSFGGGTTEIEARAL